MTYDYREKKTVIAVASELAIGTAANVIGHLALSVGNRIDPQDMGCSPIVDATGIRHMGISKYPVIVVTVKTSRLKKLIAEARTVPTLFIADFPEQMLDTAHDDELVKSLGEISEVDIRYVGIALHGSTAELQNLTGKFTLWGPHLST